VARGLAAALSDWEATSTRALAFHRRVAERFTWPRIVEAYLAVYQGAAG